MCISAEGPVSEAVDMKGPQEQGPPVAAKMKVQTQLIGAEIV